MDADNRLARQKNPEILVREAEQQWELARTVHLVNDHRRSDTTPQLRRFQADQRACAGELKRHGELVGQGLLGLLLQDPQQTTLLA